VPGRCHRTGRQPDENRGTYPAARQNYQRAAVYAGFSLNNYFSTHTDEFTLLITNVNGENTRRHKINFLLSEFRVFVIKKIRIISKKVGVKAEIKQTHFYLLGHGLARIHTDSLNDIRQWRMGSCVIADLSKLKTQDLMRICGRKFNGPVPFCRRRKNIVFKSVFICVPKNIIESKNSYLSIESIYTN